MDMQKLGQLTIPWTYDADGKLGNWSMNLRICTISIVVLPYQRKKGKERKKKKKKSKQINNKPELPTVNKTDRQTDRQTGP